MSTNSPRFSLQQRSAPPCCAEMSGTAASVSLPGRGLLCSVVTRATGQKRACGVLKHGNWRVPYIVPRHSTRPWLVHFRSGDVIKQRRRRWCTAFYAVRNLQKSAYRQCRVRCNLASCTFRRLEEHTWPRHGICVEWLLWSGAMCCRTSVLVPCIHERNWQRHRTHCRRE